MDKHVCKISKDWIKEERKRFIEFLEETDFPNPERQGKRGPEFSYPEWLIMFISVLSVKLKIKSYVRTHQMAVQYWDIIAEGLDLKAISERQLRYRLKKMCHLPGRAPAFVFQFLPWGYRAECCQCRQNDEQGQRPGLA